MGKFMLKLPSMGESVTEATLTAWLKEVGDTIEIDDSVLEVATDKVDSDVPSDVSGTLIEKRFNVNDVIQVGDIIQIKDGQTLPADCMILTSNEHRALQRRSTLKKNG